MARCFSLRSRQQVLVRDQEIALEDDEKDGLVENGEMPPQYEDMEVFVIEEKE